MAARQRGRINGRQYLPITLSISLWNSVLTFHPEWKIARPFFLQCTLGPFGFQWKLSSQHLGLSINISFSFFFLNSAIRIISE